MAELSLTMQDGMIVARPCSDEEEDSGPGRILTVEEFVERLRNRTDIFGIEKNYRLRKCELATVFLAVLAGVLLSSIKVLKIPSETSVRPDPDEQGTVTLLPDGVSHFPAILSKPPTSRNGRTVVQPSRETVGNNRNSQSPSGKQGVGVTNSRLSKAGILGMLAKQVPGSDPVEGELFANGGFASGIDRILSNMSHGLACGNSGQPVRKGVQGIGFGTGYGSSGFDGPGAGGIDDVMNSLMTPPSPESVLPLKTGPPIQMNPRISAAGAGSAIFGDARNKIEIMRVVMQNLAALRHAYNKCLREKPGLKGKVVVRFAIDEFGTVIHCEVIGSSLNDKSFEDLVAGRIIRWKFERIDKPGDITEVVYPFVFST